MQYVLLYSTPQPTPFGSPLFPYWSNVVSSSLKTRKVQLVLAIDSWIYGLPWELVNLPGATPLKENDSSPQIAINCQKFFGFMPNLPFRAWILSGLWVLSEPKLSWYEQPPCCVWKTLVLCCHPSPLALTLFPPTLFCNETQTLGRRGVMLMPYLGVSIVQSLILCTLARCGSPC